MFFKSTNSREKWIPCWPLGHLQRTTFLIKFQKLVFNKAFFYAQGHNFASPRLAGKQGPEMVSCSSHGRTQVHKPEFILYMYRYSRKSTRAGQGSLYNNVIDNILFSLPKVVNVGLEALGHEIVCDLLVVALVNVRRRYSHDLGALGCVLIKN